MDDVLDLGQGALRIGELDSVDLSSLEALIAQAEQDGKTGEIELETTK
jgi:hypothetical protein